MKEKVLQAMREFGAPVNAGKIAEITLAVAMGIAIQNVPEGAIISMPMRAAGNSRWRSFLIGSLSGAVEPIGAIAVLLLASLLMPVLPYMLAFAAGAMFYVVVEELIPEALLVSIPISAPSASPLASS